MPDGQKVVQVPGVGNIAFPGTMDDAAINAAISNHLASSQQGALQTRKGGPVINAKNLEQADISPTPGSVTRETLRGATTTVIPEGQQSTDWKQNLQTMEHGMAEQGRAAANFPAKYGGPFVGAPLKLAVEPILNAIKGALTGAGTMASGMGISAPGNIPSFGGPLDPEKTGFGGGQSLMNLLTLGLLKKTPEAIAEPFPKESVQNVMNQGPAKASFIAKQVERANAVQSTVKNTLDSVHNDGKQLMGHVSSTIDAAHPEGVFDKAEVRSTVKDAMGVVQAEQKVPAAIGKILEKESGPRSTGPTVGGRHFDLSNPSDLKAYQNMKTKGVFTPEEIAHMETGGAVGKMSFEELKQAHSEIGRQIANSEGPVEAGVKTAYAKIGTMLRNTAENHGLLNEWKEGAEKIKTFNDIAYRSPLKDTYFGTSHGKIMKPLISDELGPAVQKHLEKIEPYGLDLDALKQTVDGYRYGKKMDMLNEPSRMTPILAAISPKMAAMRIAIPRAMRTGGVTDYLYGKGLESVPEIKTNKIFPSKLAAKQTLKGNPTPFSGGGINPRGVEASTRPISSAQTIDSLSSEISTMKAKLRGEAPAEQKAALQKQIEDYQGRLDELRGQK